MDRPDQIQLKGMEAATARQKKFQALREFRLPTDGLPGSLALTHRRCGKPTCRCAKPEEPGHPQWLLTFMVDGRKRVEAIPHEWVEEVQSRVSSAQMAKQMLADLLTANAELLILQRKARARRKKRK